MSGITRIRINSNWSSANDWRLKLAEDFSPIANDIYRKAFGSIGIELDTGEETVNVTQDEAIARYDWADGIDVIIVSAGGIKMTLQEKYLTYWKSTVTFEEQKTSGKPGGWYYCIAQYYFVGYARKYWDYKKRVIIDDPVMEFQDWMLLDFSALRRADGNVDWQYDRNHNDGRRASFRFLDFDDVPSNCVIARNKNVILEQFNLRHEATG